MGLSDDPERVVFAPVWLALGATALASLAGVAVAGPWRYVPLLASGLVLGVPHGAVDHLTLPRARGERVTPRSLAIFCLWYLLAVAALLAVWFVAPAAAFLAFVGLTWFHWGQGDVHALGAWTPGRHPTTRVERTLTAAVRGGLPMLVPLVAFPDVYRSVAVDVVTLFDPTAAGALDWLFRADVRLALGGGFAALAAASLWLGYRRTGGDAAWRVDLAETGLLSAFFATVPPVVAVGLYFTVWHSLRHVVRVARLDPATAASLDDGAFGRAAVRFARDAAPFTLGGLALAAGTYGVVARGDPAVPTIAAVYLVVLSVLTVPHVAVVSLLDREQRTWRPARRS